MDGKGKNIMEKTPSAADAEFAKELLMRTKRKHSGETSEEKRQKNETNGNGASSASIAAPASIASTANGLSTAYAALAANEASMARKKDIAPIIVAGSATVLTPLAATNGAAKSAANPVTQVVDQVGQESSIFIIKTSETLKNIYFVNPSHRIFNRVSNNVNERYSMNIIRYKMPPSFDSLKLSCNLGAYCKLDTKGEIKEFYDLEGREGHFFEYSGSFILMSDFPLWYTEALKRVSKKILRAIDDKEKRMNEYSMFLVFIMNLMADTIYSFKTKNLCYISEEKDGYCMFNFIDPTNHFQNVNDPLITDARESTPEELLGKTSREIFKMKMQIFDKCVEEENKGPKWKEEIDEFKSKILSKCKEYISFSE